MNFSKLTKEEQLTILANVAEEKGIVDNAVEKDYWVSMVLRAIFSLPYAAAFVFKGGTSLSWKIQCKLPPKTKRFCPLVLK